VKLWLRVQCLVFLTHGVDHSQSAVGFCIACRSTALPSRALMTH